MKKRIDRPHGPASSGKTFADRTSRWHALGAALAQATGTHTTLVDQLLVDRR